MAAPDFMLFTSDDWDTTENGDNQSFFDGAPAQVDYASSGIKCTSGANPAYLEHDISGQSYSTVWVAVNVHSVSISGDQEFLRLSGASDPMVRIITTNATEHFKLQRWNGSSWTDVGSEITAYPLSTARRLDLKFILDDASGAIELFIDRNSVASFSGDSKPGTDTTVDTLKLQGPGGGTSAYTTFGFCMVDGADTRKLFVEESLTSSFNTDTTGGSEANVDEYPGASVTTLFNTFDAANEKSTFNWSGMDVAITDSFTVEHVGVLLAARALADPGFYFHGIVDISATEYDGDDSVQAIAGNEKMMITNFATDPSTASAWTNKSAVEAADFGVEARTTA